MNALSCRLLVFALFPSGALFAAAAPAPAPGISYPLQAQFTNHPPRLVTIGALPKATAATAAFQSDGSGLTTTDGAGKIHGVQTVVSDLGGGTQAVFSANISGAIIGRGKTNGDAAVYLAIKGANKAAGAQPAARMNLTFKGATGVTPNAQTINSAAPGFNIRLAPDGTTNSVERYDPWSGVEGLQEGWTTYQFEVHSYSINTLFTPNAPDAQPPLLVSNSVNAAIQTIDLAGYDHYHGEYVLIKFGTPIKKDRGDGYGTGSYGYISMHAAGDTTTNVPLWVIAEYVGTYPCPACPSIYDYYTNLVYGVDMADLGNCLAAYHSIYDSESASDSAPAAASQPAPRCLPAQCETNYTRSLIAATTTNTISPNFAAVVKNGRCAVNCWSCIPGTLSGTISAGKAKLVLKRSPALLEESHELWTRIPSAAGEESYLVQCCNENLTVLTNDTLQGTIQQSGRKLKLTSDSLNLSFAGSGSLVPQHGKVHGIYSAQLAGVGSAKGSSLTLKGSTRTLITGYEILTNNAPPVVRRMANLAAGDAYTLAVTNTTSGRLQVPAQALTVTQVQDNVVSVVTWSYPAFNVDNPYFKTNTVANAIDSVIANGRVMGQKWVANTIGFNLDAPYPDPLPLVPTP